MKKKYPKKFAFEEFTCPLCRSNNYEILCKKGLFKIPLNLSICKDCGFVYLNPRWTNESYNQFYQKMYDNYSERSGNSTSEIEKYSVIIDRINKITSFSENKSINILDIGSGMGNGLRTFKTKYKNSNLFAIEPSKEGQYNFKKYGIKNISNDANSNWEKTKNKFDIVVMRHVLEHLSYPEKILSKIYKTLSDQGYLYISVPNLDHPYLPLTKCFFDAVHISYFSKKNLKFFLEKNGFTVISIIDRDPHNFWEVYAICKKTKVREKDLRLNFNDYFSSKKKINNLLKKERKIVFIFYWGVRDFYWGVRNFLIKYVLNSYLFKISGIESLIRKLYKSIVLKER